MRNLEIKTPLADRGPVEERLRALGAEHVTVLEQRDTFFRVEHGWLKLREERGRTPQLISYRRATDDGRPRPSDYDVVELEDAARWHRLLGRVLAVDRVVEKERTLWRIDHTRVHLDRVVGLGEHLELETVVRDISEAEARREIDRVIDGLHLDRGAFLAVPYRDLLAAKERGHRE